ncbi:HprK-related kinase B [Enterovibrio coralii]|uniref:HprK-related kinase B n=1 Tax=Enterovibrio coralii TaxID=294935 RepID=A0A135I8T8_9GAMM|nr:HprK-related kinase B [Enterovibrio coralii]KXF81872.1 hypothetical protein ATN88_20495 [Enterovibrio coralii]
MNAFSVSDVTQHLTEGTVLLDDTLTLALPDLTITVKTNSSTLLAELQTYFANWVTAETCKNNIDILAIESPEPELPITWQDWQREPGKEGRKDAWFDLQGGRLIRKVRTGMVFLQSQGTRIAAGPCEANPNQVINFINNQYMTALQQGDWLICHAAALTNGEQAIAFAGFSGGGKSTSMLHLLSEPGLAFLSNDRLFLKAGKGQVIARGVPKLPRINPGTIVNNSHLFSLLTDDAHNHYLSMDKDALWQLEEKYDTDIEACFGKNKISNQGSLSHFIVLKWSHKDTSPTRIERVKIADKLELLDAIMKPSGPFYQRKDGSFLTDVEKPNPELYLNLLQDIEVIEVSGGVDFKALSAFCLTLTR